MRNNCFINRQSIINTTVLSFLVRRISFLFLLCFLFLVQSSFSQIAEGFEGSTTLSTSGGTGMPTGYGTGNYVLGSGTWAFNLAMKGSAGIHGGIASCALKSATASSIISPNIATAGIATINFWASNTSGSGTSLQVGVSSNGGSTYTQITGSPFTLSTTATLYSIPVNNTGSNLLVRFYRTSSTVSLDDINITAANISTPRITATGTLAAVNTTYGTASVTPTSFSVSGATMNAGILVTPPAGFEVSTNASTGYADYITFGTVGTIASTPIYARLKKTALAGNYSGNIVLSSSDAINVNVATVLSTAAMFPLNITGITAANKTYDGTTTVSLSGTAGLSITVNNDVINITGTATGLFVTSSVANGKMISITGLSLSGINYSSYSLSTSTTTANITPLMQ